MLTAFVLVAVVSVAAQQPPSVPEEKPSLQDAVKVAAPEEPRPPRMVIGPGDEGDISVYGLPDLTQHVRVSDDGDISMPLIGTVRIAGLTAEDAQALLEKKFIDGGFLKNPHVTVFIKDYSSQNITIVGEVQHPGPYSALHAQRLYDLFMAAGGLTAKAGTLVTIKHAGDTPPVVVTLSEDALKSAENNVPVRPGDTVVVSKAGIVYVVGEVSRPGGFVLENTDHLSVMQVMAMAGGQTRLASLNHARIIHRTSSGLENKDVDLQKVLKAQAPDVLLGADDILFVPASRGKMMADRASGSILSTIANLAIYRF